MLPVTVTPVGTNGAAGHEPIGPRLSVLSSERFDFGVMDRNETMTHVFEVKNVGDEVLTLKQESTSCKCTYAGAAKEELQPDETTE
ncbi:MAG TPA: DUF1573 domain-containing protein, partial [Pirellulaceae bacterium]|nr:DUF1573 domain-containing protein [Pirellulaceae bacterium]